MTTKAAKATKRSKKPGGKTGPVGQTVRPAAAEEERPDPRDNAFPESSREMLNAVLAVMAWHAEQIEGQIQSLRHGEGRGTLTALHDTAEDALKVCALSRLLYEAIDTAR